MKRAILALAALALAAAPAFAQSTEISALDPKTARTLALGGAFLAMSDGYESLFGNPAGFADDKGHLYVPAASSWLYVAPSSENIDKLSLVASGAASEEETAAALDDLITGNGIGAGAQAGIAWVGGGLGLGLTTVVDAYAVGKTALGAVLDVDTSVQAVLGLGMPLELFGLRLQLGGDIRAFYRAVGTMPFSEAAGLFLGTSEETDVMATLMAQPATAGYGVALDLGASLQLGSFKLGLAVRDIAPPFQMVTATYQDVLDALAAGGQTPTGVEGSYALYPNVVLGASFRPLPGGVLDPNVVIELQDPVGVIRDEASVWGLLHLGAEVRALGILVGRVGLNEGWISLGGGIDLAFFRIDAAVFTEELGRRPGDAPRSGIAIDATIRF
ncbi:MAG: hypothetical protein JXA15_02735 [Spirochaetales bacterium]|nr:hypothetical protein [Spirochaetales bacterium]